MRNLLDKRQGDILSRTVGARSSSALSGCQRRKKCRF